MQTGANPDLDLLNPKSVRCATASRTTTMPSFQVAEVRALSHVDYPITYELTTESGGQSNEFQNKLIN